MTGPTNEIRASRAKQAIDFYGRIPGVEADMADLLADMMHLAAREYREPFSHLLRRAQSNFDIEVAHEAE